MTIPSTAIKSLPKEDRPRERLFNLGPNALSSAELIAIILRTGTSGVSAINLSQKLLVDFGNLKSLAQASVEEISKIGGVGRVKAISLKAAFELGARLSTIDVTEKTIIKKPEDVYALISDQMRLSRQEIFKVIVLNTKNHVLKIETVTVGILNASLIHPRELFRPAIQSSAHNIILVHNHPSGDPSPSEEDIVITKKLIDAGRIVDIEVKDHVIIGDGKFVSLKQKGYV